MKSIRFRITPITLPIILFGGTIGVGTILLYNRNALAVSSISWLDALFTATSATCVTGQGLQPFGKLLKKIGVDRVVIPEDLVIQKLTIDLNAGKTLRQLDLTNRYKIQVIAVRPGAGGKPSFIPSP
ncbi:MAG: hypothetical protein J7K90_06795, partial [Desulfuromusa sp.]|nr:hypothetical protein [Desulfuromusa sp.]